MYSHEQLIDHTYVLNYLNNRDIETRFDEGEKYFHPLLLIFDCMND